MLLLRELNSENKKLLIRISNFSQFFQVRNRAKSIILLDRGFSIAQLMQVFGVSRKTIFNWLNRWDKQGFVGIYNRKVRGRKSKLNQKQKEQVKEWVEIEAYENWTSLLNYLKKILDNFGTKYVINFV